MFLFVQAYFFISTSYLFIAFSSSVFSYTLLLVTLSFPAFYSLMVLPFSSLFFIIYLPHCRHKSLFFFSFFSFNHKKDHKKKSLLLSSTSFNKSFPFHLSPRDTELKVTSDIQGNNTMTPGTIFRDRSVLFI